MKNKNTTLDALSKVLLVIFAFLLLLFSIESRSQTFTVTKCDMHDHYVIDFIDEFDDTYYVDVREFYDAEDGKRLPTKKGITFSPKVLEQVIEGLVQVQNNLDK